MIILVILLLVISVKADAQSNCYSISKSIIYKYGWITGYGGHHNLNGSSCGAKVSFYNNISISNHDGTFDHNFETRIFRGMGKKCFMEGCIENKYIQGIVWTNITANKGFFIRSVSLLNYLVP